MDVHTKRLTKEEKNQLKDINKRIQALEKANKAIRPIARVPLLALSPKIVLYENRIEDREKDLVFMLDDPSIKVEFGISGDVHYTTEVSGGQTYTGSVTGMLLGGMLAGGTGVAMGALTPRSTGIKTREIRHDDRVLIFRLTNPDGVIAYSEKMVSSSGTETSELHDKFLKAKANYIKNKKAIDAKYRQVMELKREYFSIKDDYPVPEEDRIMVQKTRIVRTTDGHHVTAKKNNNSKADTMRSAQRPQKTAKQSGEKMKPNKNLYQKRIFWILYGLTAIPFWWVWAIFWAIVSFTDKDAKQFISEKKGVFVGFVVILIGLIGYFQVSSIIEEMQDYHIEIPVAVEFECNIDHAKTQDSTYYCTKQTLIGTFPRHKNLRIAANDNYNTTGLSVGNGEFSFNIQSKLPSTINERVMQQGFEDDVEFHLVADGITKDEKNVRIHYSFTPADIEFLTEKAQVGEVQQDANEIANPNEATEQNTSEPMSTTTTNTTSVVNEGNYSSAQTQQDNGEKLPSSISPYDIKALCERGFESIGYNNASITITNSYPMGYPPYIYVIVGSLNAKISGSKQKIGTIQCQANWDSWSIKSLTINGQYVYKP